MRILFIAIACLAVGIGVAYLFDITGNVFSNLKTNSLGFIVKDNGLAIQQASERIDGNGILHLSAKIVNFGIEPVSNVHFLMARMGLLGHPYDRITIAKNLGPGQSATYSGTVLSSSVIPKYNQTMTIVIQGDLQDGKNTTVSTVVRLKQA